MGHPINHSTHSGFNWPLARAGSSLRTQLWLPPHSCIVPAECVVPAVGVGYIRPTTCSDSGRLFRLCVALLAFPLRQGLAQGVAHIRADTASISVPPSRPFRSVMRPPFVPSVAVGVGHCFTALLSPHPALLLLPGWLWFPQTVGVGQNPDSGPLVVSTGIRR